MTLKTTYIIFFVLITILFFLLCGFANQWKQIIVVEKVEVQGIYILPQRDVVKLAAIKFGVPIFNINLDSIRTGLLRNEYVEEANISRSFSGTLHIAIRERKPIGSLMFNKMWYVDDNGRLLSKIPASVVLDLPIISGVKLEPEKIKGGTVISYTDAQTAISILSEVMKIDEDLYFLISEIDLNYGKDIIIHSADYGVPINLGRGNYSHKLKLLSAFWQKYVVTRGSQNLESVDVRFKNQLVVKWKEEHKAKERTI